MLHAVTVGKVTSPVTQVAVVAVNRASMYDTEIPSAELMGRTRRILPIKIAKRKLNIIKCVVDKVKRFLLINAFPLLKIRLNLFL